MKLKIDKKNNRLDINGLKFLSLISIVFYSFNIKYFEGGYLGLDIFFVLAGFFTSNKIITDYLNNNFTFNKFILNRLRRIVPVLYLTILLCIPIVFFFQTNEEINFFSSSIFYTISFTSNYLFDSHLNNFFSPLSDYIILFHTWSLSVLFQFYIILGLCFV